MRPDFSKLLCEKPRRGGNPYHYVRKHENRGDPEELPFQKGMRRPHKESGEWKEFGENLSPLVRFLESRVGQNWDDVYAEISANIDSGNTVQAHILVHLFQYVETNTRLGEDGYVYRFTGSRWGEKGWSRIYPGASYWGAFFVDPTTKNLRFAGWKSRRRRRNHDDDRVVFEDDPTCQYMKFNGMWYAVDFAWVPRDYTTRVIVNAETGETEDVNWSYSLDEHGQVKLIRGGYAHVHSVDIGSYSGARYNTGSWVPYAKRTLSRKELRHQGLNNDRR